MITATATPLLHLLIGERTYRVPTFQRPYRWWLRDYAACRTLFEDLAELAERYIARSREETAEHFLGAALLKRRIHKLGYPEWLILDGQQRLLTLVALVKALALVAERVPDSGVEDARALLWTTPLSAQGPRPRLLASRADRADFFAMLNQQPSGPNDPPAADDGALQGACALFQTLIASFIDQALDRAQALRALDHVVRNKLKLVVIEIGEDVSPHRAFKRLNAGGEELSTLDLLKNDLFEKFENAVEGGGGGDDIPALRLYDGHWAPLDAGEALRFWARTVTRGSVAGPNADWMIRDYLRAELGRDEIRIADVRNHAEALAARRGAHAERVIEEIARAAATYRRFERAIQPGAVIEHGAAGVDLQLAVIRLFHGVDAHAPVMAVEALIDDAETAEAVKRMIEDFLVRRFFAHYREDRRFPVKALLSGLKSARDRDDPDAAVALARQVLTASGWPEDGPFHAAWRRLPVFLLKPGNVFKGAVARLLLRRLAWADDAAAWRALEDGGESQSTVEHLWPQSPGKRWRAPGDENLIHTIGNLTLCSQKLNLALANQGWTEKAELLGASGELAEHHALAAAPEWTEDAIRARSDQLFETACALWPGPEGGSEASASSSAR